MNCFAKYRHLGGICLEKAIKKGLIYGFIFGIAIAILFIKHYEINTDSKVDEIKYLPIFDYLLLIIKRGIVGSFFGGFLGCINFYLKDTLELSKKMKIGAIIFGLCVVGRVIQFFVSLSFDELMLFK